MLITTTIIQFKQERDACQKLIFLENIVHVNNNGN